MNIDSPNITIYIPKELTSDFLGTLVLDILHDAKGRGILQGRYLYELTDLIGSAFTITNEGVNQEENDEDFIESDNDNLLNNWVFIEVFKYLYHFWYNNPTALGEIQGSLSDPLEFSKITTEQINYYRSRVKLPMRSVNGKTTDDAFISLGQNRKGVEFQNYEDQKLKVNSSSNANIAEFSSPNYSAELANKFINLIKSKCGNPFAKVSLDMKSSAGLMRTITDPIGYISSLPTFADPGYYMAGMSAIRNNSKMSFGNTRTNFSYQIFLQTPRGYLLFLEPNYYWGNCVPSSEGTSSSPNRENLMVTIFGEHIHKGLQKGSQMADALGKYFTQSTNTTTYSSKEILLELEKDYYNLAEPNSQDEVLTLIESCYRLLNNKTGIEPILTSIFKKMKIKGTVKELLMWTRGIELNIAYLLATLKNIRYFCGIGEANWQNELWCIPPEHLIPQLAELLGLHPDNIPLLAFCWHQINLIEEYLSQPLNAIMINYFLQLKELLNSQWLPHRKGKLMGIKKITKDLFNNYKKILNESPEVKDSLICLVESGTLCDTTTLPNNILQILEYNLMFNYPKVKFGNEQETRRETITLSLLNFTNHAGIFPNKTNVSTSVQSKHETLIEVLGKFTGDFGQIVWCMHNGMIFATEDSNTSAMACILHRVTDKNIVNSQKWVSLHGHGDGSKVEAVF